MQQLDRTPGMSIPSAAQLIRATPPLSPTDSWARAAFVFRQSNTGALPVGEAGYLVGWLEDTDLLAAVAAAGEQAETRTVAELMSPLPAALAPSTPLAELPVLLAQTTQPLIPVLLADGYYLGCLHRADVIAALAGRFAPPRIGGMATPLGVYLTTGSVHGGAGWWGLVLAGALMALMLWVTQTALVLGTAALYHATHLIFWKILSATMAGAQGVLTSPVESLAYMLIGIVLVVAVFLGLLRVTPLMAGYHAAEHQTVNAIEAGEPLTSEAVGRMSRVHPRCGTNYWGIFQLTYLGISLLAMVLASTSGRQNLPTVAGVAVFVALAVALYWRKFGAWLQLYCTTRPPSHAEIASGIHAGQEILQRALTAPARPINLLQRIWAMGLPMVMLGAMLTMMFLGVIGAPIDSWWQSLVK